MIWKISPLVLGEILVVFVNRLTSDCKYPVEHCKNLQHPIQTELFEKRKLFPQFFVTFPESTSNFKLFDKKDHCHSECISEIRDCENPGETTL